MGVVVGVEVVLVVELVDLSAGEGLLLDGGELRIGIDGGVMVLMMSLPW